MVRGVGGGGEGEGKEKDVPQDVKRSVQVSMGGRHLFETPAVLILDWLFVLLRGGG